MNMWVMVMNRSLIFDAHGETGEFLLHDHRFVVFFSNRCGDREWDGAVGWQKEFLVLGCL